MGTQHFCLGLGVISLFFEHALFSETEFLKLFRFRVGACAILPVDLDLNPEWILGASSAGAEELLILWLLLLA